MVGKSGSPRRPAVLLLSAFVVVAIFAGCGGDSTRADLAAQDQLVQLGNRLADAHARLEHEDRLAVRQRRIAARIRATHSLLPTVTATKRPPQLQGVGPDLCSGVGKHGHTKAERIALRARERQRRRALYYLNLTCPSVGT